MWKVILQKRGLKLEELMLRKMLLWGKQHRYKADTVTAFSVPVWQGLGDKLFDSASGGSKEAASLLVTWYLLLETVKDIREQRDRMKEPDVPIAGGGQSSVPERTWGLLPSPLASVQGGQSHGADKRTLSLMTLMMSSPQDILGLLKIEHISGPRTCFLVVTYALLKRQRRRLTRAPPLAP